MPKIIVANFGATTPKVSAKLLKDNQAQTASNVNLTESRLQAHKRPSATSLVSGNLVTGGGTYATGYGNWIAYATNTIENDGGAIKIVYGGAGAYAENGGGCHFRQTVGAVGELTANLVIGTTYQISCLMKVSTGGSVGLAHWNGSAFITLATVTSTDWITVDASFVAVDTILDGLGFSGMGAGESVWIDNLVVSESLANTKTLWKCGANLIAPGTSSAECSVVDSPIQESLNRFMFTGHSYPKQSDSTHWAASHSTHRLGVTPPTVAPTVTMSGTPDVTVQKYVSYYFTMVNGWGEESAPGPATSVITVMVGEHVDLSVMTTPTDAGADFVYKRIYRLETGKAGGEYQYLTQIATAATVYEDKGTGTTLGDVSTDVCETEGWAIPPDALAGLTQGYNGMLLGYYGKEVYVSEPHAPYAWPTDYKIQLDSDVTGLKSCKEYILAVSGRYAYIITGSTPEALVPIRIDRVMKCTNARSMVGTAKGIYFTTMEGLAFCDGTDVTFITTDIITKAQWATMITSGAVIGAWYDEKYYGFCTDAGNGFIYDPINHDISTFSIATYIDTIHDVYSDATSGYLYIFGTLSDQPLVLSFDSSTSLLTYTWKSKRFVDNDRYSVAKIKGDFSGGGTLTFTWYLNGTAKTFGTGNTYKTVTSETAFRLPSDSGSQDKEFQLSGTAIIDAVQIATSPEELI